MADINTELNQILSARYGRDVRQSIHDAIAAINTQANTVDTASLQSSKIGVNPDNYTQYFTDLDHVQDGKVYYIGTGITASMIKNMPRYGEHEAFVFMSFPYYPNPDTTKANTIYGTLQVFVCWNAIYMRAGMVTWRDWYDVTNSTAEDVIKALQTDSTQNKQDIKTLQTDNTKNKSNIESLQTTVGTHDTDIDTLFGSHFAGFSATDQHWSSTENLSLWMLKPNSIYSVPHTYIEKITDAPTDIDTKSNFTIMTFIGHKNGSPENFDDFYKAETSANNTAALAATIQLIFSANNSSYYRTKPNSSSKYSDWRKITTKSDITNLDTKITKNASNITELQTESDALQKIQFTNISGDSSESLWTTAEEVNVNLFKANSIYNIPASAIVAGKVKGLPQEILNSFTTVMTFGGTTVDSPESSDDFYSSETGSGHTVPGAGTTQIAFTNGHMWQRHKISIGQSYSEWSEMENTKNGFSVFGVGDSGWNNTHGGAAWMFKPNSIYVCPYNMKNNILTDLPQEAYSAEVYKIIITLGGNGNTSPINFTDTYKYDRYNVVTSNTPQGTFPVGGTVQILIIDSKKWHRFKTSSNSGYSQWYSSDDLLKTSEYIKSLEARIVELEKKSELSTFYAWNVGNSNANNIALLPPNTITSISWIDGVTKETAIQGLPDGIKNYGGPFQILTYNGSSRTSTFHNNKMLDQENNDHSGKTYAFANNVQILIANHTDMYFRSKPSGTQSYQVWRHITSDIVKE